MVIKKMRHGTLIGDIYIKAGTANVGPSLRVSRMLLLAFAALSSQLPPLSAKDPLTSVPLFARIAGVRVGLDTMEQLERRLGKGKPTLGGHPLGARRWRFASSDTSLYADGFDSFDREAQPYAGGRQIDTFLLEISDGASELPLARLDQDRLKFMGLVGLGDPRQIVLRRLSAVLPPTEIQREELRWKATGFVRVRAGSHRLTTSWEARLRFTDDRLTEIRILTE